MTLTTTDTLEYKLLNSIIKVCQITEPVPEDMTVDSPLIGPESPFELDSLDAVEIIVMIQSDYNVRITSGETSVEVLNSLKSICDYIRTSTN